MSPTDATTRTPLPDPAAAARRSGRRTLILVAACFVIPIALAWLYATGTLQAPGLGRLARGTLVLPDRPVDPSNWRSATGAPIQFARPWGEWTLLVVDAPDCSPNCSPDVTALGNLAAALAVEYERVWIVRAGVALAESPEALPRFVPALVDPAALAGLPTPADGAPGAYLVDHRGHYVTVYPRPVVLDDVLKDLRRLLRATKAP